MIKLRVIKDVDKLNEKTYTVGDTQYWKRNGKTYKWTADGGRQECSEDEYYKALSGGTSSNDAVKNTEPTEDKANDPVDDTLEKDVHNYLNHSLGSGETNARVDGIKRNKDGTITIDYSTDVKVPVGVDSETGAQEYEDDTEYKSVTLKPEDLKKSSVDNDMHAKSSNDYEKSQLKLKSSEPAKVGTTKTLGDWSYTKVGDDSWETTYKGKKQSNRTDADIKRVFSGADTVSVDDKSEYTGPTKKVIQGKTFKVDTSSGKPTITASMYDTNERLSKLNKFAKENGITIEYEESKKKSEPMVDKGKKYKDMYAKATADYDKSQTSKDKSDLERINKHSAKRMGDYIDKLYHDTMHPPKDDKIEYDDSESDYIKYDGVSDFDHTTWSVNGYETTIQKNDRGRGYYLQNEDYDMEFDTKRDLINYLKNSGAEFYGYDSEKDY